MMVTIATSGGMGGFGLGEDLRVDPQRLPLEIRAEACALFVPEEMTRLQEASLAPGRAEGADRIIYHIELETAETVARYQISEAVLSPEVLDLLDTIRVEQE
ncbi:MAG: protealysin inhibitor emfourin [Paracoccaceae bacterium]